MSPQGGIRRISIAPIVWILLLAAALRLIGIDAPVIGEHSWRQSDTAAVAALTLYAPPTP